MMEISFKGKRALVTGAGKGIGRDLVKALVQCGAHVIALSRTQSDLDSLKLQVPSAEIVCVDLADLPAVHVALQGLDDIDLLINNAGIALLHPFLQVTPDEFDKSISVNLKAPLLYLSPLDLRRTLIGFIINITIVAKGMISRGNGGSIVNVSSQASQAALSEHTVYCSSKAGLDMLSKVMALELGPHKIRVNTVNPTVCMTDMARVGWKDPEKAGPMMAKIPLGRFAEVEDVVNAILFLLSDQAAMINGVTLPVDGGFLAT